MGHDTIWRSKKPGESARRETINVSEEMGEGGGALLINPGGMPDWLRDPNGMKVRVKAIFPLSEARPCGKCGVELPAGTEIVVADVHGDDSKLWFVYACPDKCGFVWEQRAKPQPDDKAEKVKRMKEWLA